MSSNIMANKNVAAWALKPKQRPLVVGNAPYTSPPKDHVVVKVNDVAINPVDWIIQDTDLFKQTYPTVLGLDIAGEIIQVADNVTDFRIGQRVIANCGSSKTNNPSNGAFQKFVVVPKSSLAELPYSIPTSVGVVLPLSISTASAGLYQKGFLALPLPSPEKNPKSLGRSILVWGGSSSVGSSAIQLAVASGVDVVTTASPRNFDYCRALGAREVFDYNLSKEEVEDGIVEALKGRTVVGAYHAVGAGEAVQSCARVVERAKGKAIVVSVRGETEEGIPKAVRVKGIYAGSIFENEVGVAIWREFLPAALKNGTVVPKPDPLIVGQELRSVQKGLDTQKAGVSAKKVVVSYIT